MFAAFWVIIKTLSKLCMGTGTGGMGMGTVVCTRFHQTRTYLSQALVASNLSCSPPVEINK
jgi:hypothetical protein